MANKVEKQRTALRTIGIIVLILGIALAVAGILLTCFGAQDVQQGNGYWGWIKVGCGIALIVIQLPLVIYGIYGTWVGFAIKATKGSIADPAIFKGTVNGIKCPKCGCTNTPDSKVCENCGTPLQGE